MVQRLALSMSSDRRLGGIVVEQPEPCKMGSAISYAHAKNIVIDATELAPPAPNPQDILVSAYTMGTRYQPKVSPPDWTPVYDFQWEVGMTLNRIYATGVGRSIIQQIGCSSKKMTIKPYLPEWTADAGVCNAFATSNPMRYEAYLWDGMVDYYSDNILLRYSRSMWEKDSKCYAPGPGAKSDEILLHEMIHGLRDLAGVAGDTALTGAYADYDNEEEFYAIVITNIYMSERGAVLLRKDHHTFAALANADSFLNDKTYYALMKKLVAQQSILCGSLANVNCTFNPVRDYIALQGVRAVSLPN